MKGDDGVWVRVGQRTQIVLLGGDDGGDVGPNAGRVHVAGDGFGAVGGDTLQPGDAGDVNLARREQDLGAGLFLEPARQAEVIRVHVGEHDAVDVARVNGEFLPGGLPASSALGPVEAGVKDSPTVTVTVTVLSPSRSK